MGTESISYAIGKQCAPLLAGVKPSNLLILERGHVKLLDEVLEGSGLCRYLLYTSEQKDFWFVFEERLLGEIIEKPEHAAFLQECGYAKLQEDTRSRQASGNAALLREDRTAESVDSSITEEISRVPEQILSRLAARFTAYKREEEEFPHEMGVLLGYPLNDVLGFIYHQGKDFKMSGYWKVYDDVTYADRMFRLYEQAKQAVLHLCRQGFPIPEICAMYRTVSALS